MGSQVVLCKLMTGKPSVCLKYWPGELWGRQRSRGTVCATHPFPSSIAFFLPVFCISGPQTSIFGTDTNTFPTWFASLLALDLNSAWEFYQQLSRCWMLPTGTEWRYQILFSSHRGTSSVGLLPWDFLVSGIQWDDPFTLVFMCII